MITQVNPTARAEGGGQAAAAPPRGPVASSGVRSFRLRARPGPGPRSRLSRAEGPYEQPSRAEAPGVASARRPAVAARRSTPAGGVGAYSTLDQSSVRSTAFFQPA
ncbi:hypothetical protein SAV14893_068860 [Streptomyces avermitilis]|uniref:Uncharacterized protein n=1 Tax=Streptomyces avermitilis TaxID=33903 RepID=A0A4D4M6U1_STRAX|nr:hypothetical protein SAVMC3_81630 [Streptomyces avermitilis]GDY67493.1 hypothetical protein SAV14893_068860 [Streptomyces avermitilis]GDY72213.1 hypothetical protein SAV31267_016980 [Streptomyces avermitilis]GDY81359.1 hypothetical protein SAVCW2_05580 [Streptomyces avermitilis]